MMSTRGVRSRWRFGWLCLAIALFAASAGLYSWLATRSPGGQSDEYVYRAAGIIARSDPASLYNARLGEPGFAKLPYLYPPLVAYVLGLFSSFSFTAWRVALVGADLALLPVTGYLAFGLAGYRGRQRATGAFALAALSVWLEPVWQTMFYGQINLIPLALCLWDLALPDSSRWKGTGIGLAAGIKLTPLIFAVYLLASRRIRAGLVSVAVFALTIAAGYALLPAASGEYWAGRFLNPEANVAVRQNQSLYAFVAHLLSDGSHVHQVWLMFASVVGIGGLTVAVIASRRGLELLGVVTCAVTGLLVSQVSWAHHWVWVIPCVALIASIRPLWARLAGLVAVTAIFFMWPALPWGSFELAWLDQGIFVITGLVALTGAAAYLWLSRDHDRYLLAATRPRTGAGVH
jgi:alpha-1,2-mannosyltransferase